MEVAGLVIGVAGLAGLFKSCIDCFELVQRGRYIGKEYLLLETKFNNQRLRLVTWGRACGLTGDSYDSYDTRLDEDPEVRRSIESTLGHLLLLLRDGDGLSRSYGLRNDSSQRGPAGMVTSVSNALVKSRQKSLSTLGCKLRELESRIKSAQKDSSSSQVLRWIIEDRNKFGELIQHLKDLNDDLEHFTRDLGVPDRQRSFIRDEIESINDFDVLEAVEEARVGQLDPISDAASIRLWQVKDGLDRIENSSTITSHEIAPSPARSVKRVRFHEDEWEVLSNNEELGSAHVEHFQVLYRVSCPQSTKIVYLDPPTYNSSGGDAGQWVVLQPGSPLSKEKLLHLCGKRRLNDIELYFGQHPELEFVSFQDFVCDHEPSHGGTTPSPVHESIRILSSTLRDLFIDPIYSPLDYYMKELLTEPRAELPAPYMWYYSRKDYIWNKFKDRTEIQVSLYKRLADFIEKSMESEYDEVAEEARRGVVSWKYLNYLYHHDLFVIKRRALSNLNTAQIFAVRGQLTPVPLGSSRLTASSALLRVFALQVDGRDSSYDVKINRTLFDTYNDEVPLDLLPMVPVGPTKYFRERGRKVLRCHKWRYVRGIDTAGRFREPLDIPRFVVDPVLHSESIKSSTLVDEEMDEDMEMAPASSSFAISAPSRPDFNPERFGDDIVLLPPSVWGFDLREHVWRKLCVSYIEPLLWWDLEALDALILEPREKRRLASMLINFFNGAHPNKHSFGQYSSGLNLLFCGPCGTGKSFAAAAIAERRGSPLFYLTPEMLKSDNKANEVTMRMAIRYANAWDCVLLLEGVDTVEMNDFGSLKAILDSFNGIFILTAREKKELGRMPDLMSRIDLLIEFPSLTETTREVMWRHILENLIKHDTSVPKILHKLPALSRYELNGHDMKKTTNRAQLVHFNPREPRKPRITGRMLLEEANSTLYNIYNHNYHNHLPYFASAAQTCLAYPDSEEEEEIESRGRDYWAGYGLEYDSEYSSEYGSVSDPEWLWEGNDSDCDWGWLWESNEGESVSKERIGEETESSEQEEDTASLTVENLLQDPRSLI
ncbi:prion-inhibition and propagation-domain-containing protein [Xylariaceae sp. FL1019]|nr:prion-inhibition and propagation-domain-containing protein [Xylariaceae sp. FL1019]